MSSEGLSRIGRGHRRRSISVPTGLDALLAFAEKSWQPPRRDSFDELQEEIQNQSTYNSAQGQAFLQEYGGSSGETGESEEEEDEDALLSGFSDMEPYPSPAPFPRRHGRHRRGYPRSNHIQLELRKPQDPDDEDDIMEDIRPKPLSSRRKSATVPPLKIQNSSLLSHGDGGGRGDDPEAGGTATPPLTPSSISGLIKGRWNSMSIPQVFKKQKPREYKLQVFVAFLFLTIMLLVGSIYVIHKEKELHKAYFEQIRFSGKERKIRVVNMKGKEVLSGVLGTSFTRKDKAWPCLTENMRVNSTCLEWMNKARLYFRKLPPPPTVSVHTPSSIQCYEVYWESLSPEFQLKDCFYMTQNKGFHWYGGGELLANHWPLNKTRIPFKPFRTGNKVNLTVTTTTTRIMNSEFAVDESGNDTLFSQEDSVVEESFVHFEWGRVLSRHFISSPGASIKVNADTPLHLSMNEGENNMLCVGARKEGFPLRANRPDHLNYSICTGDNIRDVERYLADKDIWDGLKHEDVQLTYKLTQAPIWKILPHVFTGTESDEMNLLNHTNRIAELQFSEGYILIDESWQKHIGDLTMDTGRFPTMGETFNITRRRGFKVALTLSPFFSTESSNYNEGLQRGVWAWQPPAESRVPALTKYKQWSSVALLDSSGKGAEDWMEGKVRKIATQYGIDAVYLDLGTAEDFPRFASFGPQLSSLDNLGKYFIDAVRKVNGLTTIGVSTAVHLPKLPTFIGLSPVESSWQGLQSLIPNILSVGISGYPYIIPGSIGGDYGPEGRSDMRRPERNLYIRWLELAHFFPVVQYSHLPSDYDDAVEEIAKEMSVVRKQKVLSFINKAIDDSLTSGLPIIRPLWMLDPMDINCLRISDEFLIGNDVLVAPILQRNTTDRDIYLPRGKWRDERDGSNTKGEKWLHHYRIRENQIAFFTRLQDSVNVI